MKSESRGLIFPRHLTLLMLDRATIPDQKQDRLSVVQSEKRSRSPRNNYSPFNSSNDINFGHPRSHGIACTHKIGFLSPTLPLPLSALSTSNAEHFDVSCSRPHHRIHVPSKLGIDRDSRNPIRGKTDHENAGQTELYAPGKGPLCPTLSFPPRPGVCLPGKSRKIEREAETHEVH